MTRVFTLNMFQNIVTAVAATSFFRGQDFHASRAQLAAADSLCIRLYLQLEASTL